MTMRVAEAARQGFSFSRAAALVSRVSRSSLNLKKKRLLVASLVKLLKPRC